MKRKTPEEDIKIDVPTKYKKTNETEEKTIIEGQIIKREHKIIILIIGYNGNNFFGSQKQNNEAYRTVEGELIQTFIKANMVRYKKQKFSVKSLQIERATRTDKKVHAIQNFFTANLYLKKEISLKEIFDEIKKFIPNDIKLYSIMFAPEKFSPRFFCEFREYEYFIPSFCFCKKVNPINQEDLMKYKIDQDLLNKINDLCSKFKGTRKYHNYTKQSKNEKRSFSRCILEINCQIENIENIENNKTQIEFLKIFIKGQSFVFNQIRKMVGALIFFCRKNIDNEILNNTFLENSFDIPLAPGEGLLLFRPSYDSYNKTLNPSIDKSKSIALSNEALEEMNQFHNEIKKFIFKKEIVEKNYSKWIQKFDQDELEEEKLEADLEDDF